MWVRPKSQDQEGYVISTSTFLSHNRYTRGGPGHRRVGRTHVWEGGGCVILARTICLEDKRENDHRQVAQLHLSLLWFAFFILFSFLSFLLLKLLFEVDAV